MNFSTTSMVARLIEEALGNVEIFIEEAQVKSFIPCYLGGEVSAMIESNVSCMAVDFPLRSGLS